MAYLLVLNGPRLDELFELDPGATLTLGSSADAHIQLPDPDVAAVHGRVYPAEGRFWLQDLGQGYTLLNLDHVSGATQELYPHDVLILGRTFLKFVAEPPAARGGAGASHAVKAKQAEIERLRKRLTQAQSTTSKARRELASVQESIEAARAEERAAADEVRAELESARETHQAELESARETHRAELESARDELEAVRAAHRAQRESARVLHPLVFERDAAGDRLEDELRALRARASQLAADLALTGGAP